MLGGLKAQKVHEGGSDVGQPRVLGHGVLRFEFDPLRQSWSTDGYRHLKLWGVSSESDDPVNTE